MKIQPITSWQDGQELQGTDFVLRIETDNMSSYAVFVYTISTEQVSHTETVIITPEIPAWDETLPDGEVIHHDLVPAVTREEVVVDVPSIQLVVGRITIDGADYQQWDLDPNANTWAYNWAANKLNLILLPDQIIA